MCKEIFRKGTPVAVPELADYIAERRAFERMYNDLCVELRRSNWAIIVMVAVLFGMTLIMALTYMGG